MKVFMSTKTILLLLGASLSLSGCISVGAKPQVPGSLLTLSPHTVAATDSASTVNTTDTISIAMPVVSQELTYTRIPVYDSSAQITYLKGAVWIEPPAHLLKALLTETITAKTGRVVIDQRQSALPTGTTLSGRLVKFGVDASTGNAVVTYDALLAHTGNAQVAARRFQALVPLHSIDGPHAGAALNQAANVIADQIADWISTH